MAKTTNETQLPFASADVAAEVVRWLAYLAAERRMSPKTVEAMGATSASVSATSGSTGVHR
jgi:hypothetical protein